MNEHTDNVRHPYTVYLTNVERTLQDAFLTEHDAIQAGKNTGFEFSVYRDNKCVGGYSIFGGYNRYDYDC